ncbi:hypothetical protein GCM10023189_56440 [Nibrella saemangeumensis]|uniref:PKD domain-containing protein n=1 Tax=Nibrella saemangeumensis TaxID=1084526 RepID=A0ABP8NPV2_9BACT
MKTIFYLSFWLMLCSVGVSVAQTTRYVRAGGTGDGSSWSQASGDLQAMINASSAGDQVWVAAGVYKPTTSTTDRNASFQMKNGVQILGGFPATGDPTLADRPAINPVAGIPSSTTLSGDIDNDGTLANNSYHLFYHPYTNLNSTAVLNGFVVTGGNANGGGGLNNGDGGAFYNLQSSPMLTNCSLQGNSATKYGGAFYNAGSSPVLTNCSLQGNSATLFGGAFYNVLQSSPVLTNCSLQGNSATLYGGAFYNLQSSSPVLTNCSLQGNSASNGGAFYNYLGSSPVLTNCSLQGNSATGAGGAVFNYGERDNIQLTNCSLVGNLANAGGAFFGLQGSSPVLANCSLVGNSANVGGAFYSFQGSPHLTNCSLQGNSATLYGGAFLNDFSSPVLTNCSLQGNSATGAGGAFYNTGYLNVTLANCVVFNNGGANTVFNTTDSGVNSATTTARYSLLDNTTGVDISGPGNLTTTTSPFTSTASVALAAGSPAINAGDVASYTAVGGPATDLAGNPRIVGGRIDMGAVEFQETTCTTPVLTAVKTPLDPVAITTPVTLTISYAETNVTSATITWGDATADQTVGNPSAPQSHTYARPGVYTISVRIGNDCGLSSATVMALQYVVVYDPSAGFVTGGGWIDSPVVSTTACASCTFMQVGGRANFGFEAKYQKGQSIPAGNTEFKFRAGGLDFRSTAYEWLVVAGNKAQYKGTGSVNGQSGYGFMLTATDGDLNKTKGPDRFRIKIWQVSSGQTVYDNQYGAGDTADPTTVIGGGSIVIHDPSGKNAREAYSLPVSAEVVQVVVAPNPVEQVLAVEVRGLSGQAQLHLVDVQGRQRGSWSVEPVNGIGHLRTEAGHLPTGVYLLQVETTDGVLSRQRVLKR